MCQAITSLFCYLLETLLYLYLLLWLRVLFVALEILLLRRRDALLVSHALLLQGS